MVDRRATATAPGAVFKLVLRYFALSLFIVYVTWNLCWLSLQQLAPSLLTGLTGLPCPTTGGTRAILALLAGDWQASWNYNPLALPMTALFALSLGLAVFYRWRHRRLVLPSWIVPVWLGLLAIAWIAKLLTPPAYW